VTNEDGRERWEQERRTYIGGSEVYELLERPQYGRGCKRALSYRKLGAEPDVPVNDEEDLALFKRGNLLEPIVATLYQQQTGRKLRKAEIDVDGFPVPKRHSDYPWAAVSTDRLILAFHGGTLSPGDLEIKSRAEGPFLRVLRKGPFDGDLLQVQWSLWIRKHSWGALAILGLCSTLPLVTFDISRDLQLHEIFERVGSEFAEKVWGKGELPEPTFPASDPRCKVCCYRLTCRGQEFDYEEAAVQKAIKASKKELVQIENPTLAKILGDIDLLKAERNSLDESIHIAQDRALEELGEEESIYLNHYGKVYRVPSQINRLDTARLKADRPELYEEYTIHRLTGEFYIRSYPQVPAD
jgi:predicted phage-related endonuclease